MNGILNQSIFRNRKKVLHIFVRSATGPGLDAGSEQARGAGLPEENRSGAAALGQHEAGHLPYLPLGSAAEAETEEVVQLPRVHRQDQVGLPAVGQDKAGVLRGNAQGQEFFVGLVGGLSLLDEEPCGRGLGRHDGGDDDVRSVHADVALTLLAEAGDAVPHQLV